MKKVYIMAMVSVFILPMTFSQTLFRSGIFLHHSTGAYIWGPNPDGNSTTTIPDQMTLFNINHGLSGGNAISMEEEWWEPGDNEWATQHEFFEGNTAFTDINYYLGNFPILVIKSCFPSSAIESGGQASDTLDPYYKSIYNYKWHWRHILTVMKNNPDNFFAIWTNAPLGFESTNPTQAMLSREFCAWAKDTLAEGLDPVFGSFPPNVYVFDYFDKLTDADGYQLPQYATAPYDSHPNGYATDFIAPQFVNEIFSAAMAYEQIHSVFDEPGRYFDIKCYPNPFVSTATITFTIRKRSMILFSLYDLLGNMMFELQRNQVGPGLVSIPVDLTETEGNIFIYKLTIDGSTCSGKMILNR
ncbi:MAG: hypothetical protein FJY10_04620 [Bacteroidetes bacterium]|nr:hypothetical protein [Bacteroidota bacterium]